MSLSEGTPSLELICDGVTDICPALDELVQIAISTENDQA